MKQSCIILTVDINQTLFHQFFTFGEKMNGVFNFRAHFKYTLILSSAVMINRPSVIVN